MSARHTRHEKRERRLSALMAIVFATSVVFGAPAGAFAADPTSTPEATAPAADPTVEPTVEPTERPTPEPTERPTEAPKVTDAPKATETPKATEAPAAPTDAPSSSPSATDAPTPSASGVPTAQPSSDPSVPPTDEPTATPDPTVRPGPAPEPTATPSQGPEWIITFAKGQSAQEQRAVLAATDAHVVSSIPDLRMHVVSATADSPTLVALRTNPAVSRVERNAIRSTDGTPSDPRYTDQWSLPRIGWDDVYGHAAPKGKAIVALLDSGVDTGHPDLHDHIVPGWNILSDSDDTADTNGHGTWLAGIIAADTDDSKGIAGVGFAGVSVMPVVVLDADGRGTDADIIAGIVYAVSHDADVINMSFSNRGYSSALQAAIDYAWDNDVVIVAAAGNDGADEVTFPAGDRGVIGVSNTDHDDRIDPSSNFGAAVFLGAPGTDIVGPTRGGGYHAGSGTSASSAIVAGAAALLRAFEPDLSNGQIVSRLALGADPAGSAEQTGNGRLDIARSLFGPQRDPIEPVGAAPIGAGGPILPDDPSYEIAGTNERFSVVMTPTSSTAGVAASYSFTLTKINTGNRRLDRFDVAIPAGYTGVTVSTPVVTGGKTWVATVNAGSIHFQAAGSANSADSLFSATPQETLSTTISATAPCVAGNKTWTTTSADANGFSISGAQPVVNIPVACPGPLEITAVNGGSSVVSGTSFSVTVQSFDGDGGLKNVTLATGFSLSLDTGSGVLGGTLTGTIPAGQNTATVSGVTYTNTAGETAVALAVTRTSGDVKDPGDSDPFVVVGTASTLRFVQQPTDVTVATNFASSITVEVTDSVGNRRTMSPGNTPSITLAIDTNPGGGTLSPATAVTATAGLATFPNRQISAAGIAYTLKATATGLSQATSDTFDVYGGCTWNTNTSGNWTTAANWTCTSPTANRVPLATDDVTIARSASTTVTIPANTAAVARSIILGPANGNPQTLTLSASTSSLTVAHDVTIRRSSNNNTTLLSIGAGTASIGGTLTLSGTATNAGRIASATVSTGSLTIAGDLVFETGNVASNVVTLGAGAVLDIGGNFTFTVGTLTPGTNSTVNFSGTAATQVIPIGVSSVTYNNLTASNTSDGGAELSAAVSATNVTGNLRVLSGSLDNNGFAVVGAAAKTFEVANGATFIIGDTSGMVTGFGTKTLGASSTVEYSGAAQTISAESYGNLTFGGSGNKSAATGTTTIRGDLDNEAGTFVPGTSTYAFAGSSAQSITGLQATTFNNLTINNSAGVSLSGVDATVNGALTLTAGDLTTGANTLVMPVGATSSGTTDVVGNVKRTGTFVTSTAYAFGNPFNTIAFTAAGTKPTEVTMNLVKSAPASPAFPGTSISRTYAISQTGGTGFSATVRLHYLDTELNGLTEANLRLWKVVSGAYAVQGRTGSVDTTNNWAELAGVTAFGTYTLADKASQTITVTTPAPGSATFGATFNVAAIASSGLTVAITVTGGCSGSGSGSATITMTSGTASCVVHYNQAGNADNNAAPEVTSTTTASKANQTINVGTPAPSSAAYGATFNVAATATSGLTVAITVTGGCSGSGSGSATITMTSGTVACVVRYDQAGSADYNAASQVTNTVTATKRPITVTANAGQSKVVGAPDPVFAYTVTSGSLINGNTFTGALSRVAGESIGTYAITIGTLAISDGNGGLNYTLTFVSNLFSITAPPNTAPVAVADSYTAKRDSVLVVPAAGVLANDTDAEFDTLSVASPRPISGPSHAASFTLNADGSFSYTPTAGYVGSDSFTYKANDGQLDSASAATVTITVTDGAYTSSANWSSSFSGSRYLKFSFPAYVPTGSAVTTVTFRHEYRSTTSGTTCYYFEVYAGNTLIGTHGSSGSPVSCTSSSTTYAYDAVALPEANTAAKANTLSIKMFVRNSAGGSSTHRTVTLGNDYSLD